MPVNAKLHIETALRNGKTSLLKTFCTQPFKIADVTEDRQRSDLHLMLMSSSPGVLDGDTYELHLDVGEGCSLQLETQSYQRLFQMKEGASQQMEVCLGKGSRFAFLPHPVVPHRQSRFKTKSRIYLQDRCSLLWGEVVSCGRKLNGEQFQFSSYHSLTEIFLNNKLVVKENLLLRPLEMDLNGIGQLEGFTHQSTLLYLDEEVNISKLVERIVETLHAVETISFGVSALPVNGMVVRMLGHRAEQLFGLQKQIAGLLKNTKPVMPQKPVHYVA